ncbi:MAG TPA: hypothetical protein VE783_02840 [Candidatus Limnocylindrales bacterium]|jgi:hypothetical protein|nr:hypothetical protein [Candidatus Limnocylindrales bacterium]
MMNLKKLAFLALVAAAVALAGCDSEPQKSTPAQKKTNEYETGRFALQKLIPSARLWSPDAQPVTLESSASSEALGHDGKAGNWRAVFGSASRRKAEPFLWSGMADAPQKVDHGVEDSFNPSNRSTQPWDLAFLKIDTDKAFEVAQQHGGKQIVEKDPKTPVSYRLGWNAQANQLLWSVVYGDSGARPTFLVDASSGAFVRKE